MTLDTKIAAATFGALLLWEIVAGEYRKPRVWTANELGVSIGAALNLFTVRALQLLLIATVLPRLVPQWQGALADTSAWLVFPIAMLIDDYGNYWLHRGGHTVPWMWRLHKPHHTPTRLNVLATMRNNWMFNALLPNTWIAGTLLFLGATHAALAMLVLKIVVVYLQHTAVRWDLAIRRVAIGRAVLDVFEKIFVLQDYHHVHHGIGRYGNTSANYANVFVVWDHLHGTSVGSPHRVQDAFGLPVGVRSEPWYEQLWWPVFRSKPATSAVRKSTPQRDYSAAEVAEARAVIYLADGRAVVVGSA
jgi:sterol desaturase/sphingolipid hydroxylase (fatty acid hydroxylase superfamily)